MSPIITIGLVAAALASQAPANQIETSRPDVGPLEPQFRVNNETRADGTWKTGFYNSEPLCVGHWVVLSFGKTRGGFGSRDGVGEKEKQQPSPSVLRAQLGYIGSGGLIACNLDTGRAIELISPRPNRQPDRVISVLFHYRLDADRCAVVIGQLQKTGIDTGKVLGTYLWEWSLETNSLKPIGKWDAAALLKLALDRKAIDASLVAADSKGAQAVELRDKETGRATQIVLEGPRFLEPSGGGATAVFGGAETIIPQSDRRSFIVYHPGFAPEGKQGNEYRLECVDPRSPNGRRWILTQAKLEAPTRQQHAWIFPIGGLSLASGLIAIGMTDAVDGPDHLAIVEGSTGQTKRLLPLPKQDRGDMRQDWRISPDGSSAVYVAQSHIDDFQTTRALFTVNTKTGRVTRRWDDGKRLRYFGNPFAVDDRNRILMLDGDSVDRVTLDDSLSTERIFQLNPLMTQRDKKISAAGIRLLADFKSLTSLKLSRMELSAGILRELSHFPRLEHLEIDLADEPYGDLSGLAETANLRSLTLTGKLPNLAAYREVGRLRNLQELDLRLEGGSTPKGALDELRTLTNLVSLRVNGFFDDDWRLASLRALKNLKVLQFGFSELGDEDLAALKEFPQLTHLDIYTAATGAGVKHLKSLAHLTDLRLSLNRNRGFDAVVSELAACRHLRRLRLADNNELSPGVLQKLGQLPDLTELDLHGFGIENGAEPVDGLVQCKNLKWLRLSYYSLKPGDVKEILKLKNLKLFDHSDTWNAEVGLRDLFRLKSLEELDIFSPQHCSPGVTDEGLAGIEGLSNLRVLQLSGNAITDSGLQRIAALTQLVQLKLAHTYVTDQGLARLKPLSRLAELDLFDTEILDGGLKELGALGRLRDLDLGMTQITDAGLKHLARLSGLCRLNLESTSITNAGLHHLAAIESLEELDLSSTAITDAGLKELRSLKNLRSLALKRTAVTDAGLSELQALPHLASLSLGR
jgi:Leucine-rich repeat (LRR) protein